MRGATVKRMETHQATGLELDAHGRDWNNDVVLLYLESGEVVEIDAYSNSGIWIRLLPQPQEARE